PLTVRADSAFHSSKVIKACRRHGVAFSITVNQNTAVRAAIDAIPEQDWVPIGYPDGGLAEVPETEYQEMRLIVRRTRLVGPQAQLWPDWRHHAFITNRIGTAVELDADHRRHAPSSSPSGISKNAPGCATARPGSSSPTRPGP
ncbi:MAG: hypothetical protein ACRDV9_12500, partial [Acidimicrobiia bacterium]